MPNRVAPKLDVKYLRTHDWWSRVDVRGPNECWPWKLSIGSHGYGQTWDGITVRVAHRVAWELTHGHIRKGWTVDHVVCANRVCCNPAHMRVVPNEVNGRANARFRRTHCARGHEFTPENTGWVHASGRKHPYRQCRICARSYYDPAKRRARYLRGEG